jgi:acyl-homoserine-lactone acylase
MHSIRTYAARALAPLLLLTLTSCATVGAPSEAQRWQSHAQRVTITRDDWGIAHVRGKTDADAVFGMIYAQAEDDFNRVENNYLTSLGRMAEAEGEKAIWQDLRARLYMQPDDLQARYASSPDWLKRLMNAWADGLNYYLATHPEVRPRAITRFEPWMALSFTEGSIGADIERISLSELEAFYGTRRGELRAEAEVRPLVAKEPTGSNGFAIAPAKTASGNALLLINPHTSFFFRSEQQMTSDEGLNAYGATTWGQFFIYQGFNDRLGWMHTTSGVDSVDQFLETIEQGEGGLRYRYGAELRPVQTSSVALRVRAADGTIGSRNFEVYRTHHGPIVAERDGKWVSNAMMHKPVEALSQSYLRTKARSFADYMRVMEFKANSSNNTIYADADGNIAYLHPQFVPVREGRTDYTKAVDGSDPATDWRGLHALPTLPFLRNPANGWIQNTNNWPYSAAGAYSPKPQAFPRYMDVFGENPRGLHAQMVLQSPKPFTLESLRDAAYDPYQPGFATLVPALIQAYDQAAGGHALKNRLAGPVDALRGWNMHWGAGIDPKHGRDLLGFRTWPARPARHAAGRGDRLSRDPHQAGTEAARARCRGDPPRRRFRPLGSALGRGQPLPAFDRRHRPAVQRRRSQHPRRLHDRQSRLARGVRRRPLQGQQTALRHARQQLRLGGRVRQPRPGPRRVGRRPERQPGLTPFQRPGGTLRDRQSARSLFLSRTAARPHRKDLQARPALERLPRGPSAGPGPLEVVAAEPAGDVHAFPNRVKARNRLGFHGLR